MNLSAPFIRRPVATTLLTAAIAIAGGIAFNVLPVSPLPQVDFPTISVSAGLPGSQRADHGLLGGHSAGAPVRPHRGRHGDDLVQFAGQHQRDPAIRPEPQYRRRGARRGSRHQRGPNLPARQPSVQSQLSQGESRGFAHHDHLALTSDKYDKEDMYDSASTIMQQKLSQIQGVGQVSVGGASYPSVRVDVNPPQLNHYGITIATIQRLLSLQNSDLARGQITNNLVTADIVTNDQISKADEYKPLIVGYHNGLAVHLSDVADVQDSAQSIRTAGYLNGIPSVTVIIFRQPGANIIQTNQRIHDQLPFLAAVMPQGIKTTVVLDRTTTIKASLHDVETSLILSVILVILVVFLFLRNGRATLIPSVAVPVSLIGTFAVMYLLGYSLDNLSLMALTISTGFVVDDAIVVMENISRYLEMGMPPHEAALKGAKEIGFTVLTMSTSLIAVFIPLLMMGGIVGRLFREFAVTLSTAIIVSMVISLTTTPMMCAHLLKPHDGEKHGRHLSRQRALL